MFINKAPHISQCSRINKETLWGQALGFKVETLVLAFIPDNREGQRWSSNSSAELEEFHSDPWITNKSDNDVPFAHLSIVLSYAAQFYSNI